MYKVPARHNTQHGSKIATAEMMVKKSENFTKIVA